MLDDFTYYWFHRISHECRFWWAAHVNHHSSQQYNWTSWIPLAFLGFPPAMILAEQGFNLFYQFWIHTEVVGKMHRWFEYLFNTSCRDAVGVVLGPPGWRADGRGRTSTNIRKQWRHDHHGV